jgi:hypothetical protein
MNLPGSLPVLLSIVSSSSLVSAILLDYGLGKITTCRKLWHMGVHCENAPDWGCGWLNENYFKEKLGFLRQAAADYGWP